MRILVDTNVILDVLCNRTEFVEASSQIWKRCEVEQIEGFISALSVPNIVYILRKELSPQKTKQLFQQITMIFKIVDLKATDLKEAAEFTASDYDEAVLFCQARRIRADYIVTRTSANCKDSRVKFISTSKGKKRVQFNL